jgi:hypothetical protein
MRQQFVGFPGVAEKTIPKALKVKLLLDLSIEVVAHDVFIRAHYGDINQSMAIGGS